MSSLKTGNNKRSFFEYFPMPKMLRVPAYGVDISDTTIKLIEISRNRKGNRVVNFADKSIEPGIVESGEIKNPKELSKALSELKRKHKITSAHASLPEERAYLFEAEFTVEEGQKLRDIIEFHLEENVPLSVEEAVFDYDVIKISPKGKVRVSVSVMPREVVDKYSEAFRGAEIWLESLEIEAQSIARAVIPEEDIRTHMIADFGRSRTGVAIVTAGVVGFTSTIEVGGDHFTKIISENKNLSNQKEAEKLKEEKGLLQGDELLDSALLKYAEKFADEMAKHVRFWNGHSKGGGTDIEKIILCGGNATVPGIKECISERLDLSVTIANVWQNVFDVDSTLPPIKKGDSMSFATAIGLALRAIKE